MKIMMMGYPARQRHNNVYLPNSTCTVVCVIITHPVWRRGSACMAVVNM